MGLFDVDTLGLFAVGRLFLRGGDFLGMLVDDKAGESFGTLELSPATLLM